MIVAEAKQSRTRKKTPWIAKRGPRRWLVRGLGVALLCGALGAAFLAGAVAQREKHIRRWKTQVADWRLRYEPRMVASYLDSWLGGEALPTLVVDMKFKNFDRIQKKRQEALDRGVLLTSDDDFVTAEIRMGDEVAKAKMRLKGDDLDHLLTEKWSYRIEVQGDSSLLGMRRFSIQHPMTRAYHLEWAFHEHARREGLVAPRYAFVQVEFNGTRKGIYALEEHFAKEMLESHGRREGVILKFEEGPQWTNWARSGKLVANDISSRLAPRDFRLAEIDAFQSSRTKRLPALARQRSAGITLLREMAIGQRIPSEVFDADLTGRFLALVDFWGASHALSWVNLRFYYNPVTTLLEPIPFDAEPTLRGTGRLLVTSDAKYIEGLWGLLLADPAIAESYLAALERMTEPGYLETLRKELGGPLEGLLGALHREWPGLEPPWDTLERNRPHLRGAMDPAAWAVAYLTPPTGTDGEEGPKAPALEVSNLLALPLRVVGYRIGGGDLVSLEGGPRDLPPASWREASPPLTIDLTEAEFLAAAEASATGAPVEVLLRMARRDAERIVPVQTLVSGGRRVDLPDLEEALHRHPFLSRSDDGLTLRVAPGEWEVPTDLVLPAGVGLEMGPGTTLRFSTDAMLHASGPFRWLGTEEEPVRLGPAGEDWPGMVLDRAGGRSTLRDVVIEGTRGIDREGWLLTGGITFHKSPVSLTRCRILGSSAEDLINVIHAEFEFVESEFGECDSDAFDGDFVSGRIEACGFHDVGGDAVDVSGSTVSLERLVLNRIADKAISAGEDSEVTAHDVLAREVGIALASKDLSRLVVQGVAIEGARIGLAAYVKKPVYGPASIEVTDATMESVEKVSVIQKGSSARLNGKGLPGVDLDVKRMYEEGILGN